MFFSKIKVTQEFQYHGVSSWLHAEITLNEAEDPKVALHQANNFVQESWVEISPEHNGSVVIQKSQVTIEIDTEFEDVKEKLSLIQFQEEAQDYINTTDYSYTIEAKKLIAAKPFKNK